jgi:hypothetical protein
MLLGLVNGPKINYSKPGSGEPVHMVMGTCSPGYVWQLHKVPALVAAGYRHITFNIRGIAPPEHGGPKRTIQPLPVAGPIPGQVDPHPGLLTFKDQGHSCVHITD